VIGVLRKQFIFLYIMLSYLPNLHPHSPSHTALGTSVFRSAGVGDDKNLMIEVVEGPLKGEVRAISRAGGSIGRSSDNSLCIPVSRKTTISLSPYTLCFCNPFVVLTSHIPDQIQCRTKSSPGSTRRSYLTKRQEGSSMCKI
jgi:hypothetical protein